MRLCRKVLRHFPGELKRREFSHVRKGKEDGNISYFRTFFIQMRSLPIGQGNLFWVPLVPEVSTLKGSSSGTESRDRCSYKKPGPRGGGKSFGEVAKLCT